MTTTDNQYPADLDLVICTNTHNISAAKLEWLTRQRYVTKNSDTTYSPHYPSLFRNSVHNFYFTPLHELVFRELYPNDIPTSICPPIVDDIEAYKPRRPKKRQAVCMSTVIAAHKGAEQLIRFAWTRPDLPILLYGRLEVAFQDPPPNLKYMGTVGREEARRILGESEYFIFLLNSPGNGSMACLEAYLSGCKLITNEYEGLWTLDWPWGDREAVRDRVRDVPTHFWNTIAGVLEADQRLVKEVKEIQYEYAQLAKLPDLQV